MHQACHLKKQALTVVFYSRIAPFRSAGRILLACYALLWRTKSTPAWARGQDYALLSRLACVPVTRRSSTAAELYGPSFTDLARSCRNETSTTGFPDGRGPDPGRSGRCAGSVPTG